MICCIFLTLVFPKINSIFHPCHFMVERNDCKLISAYQRYRFLKCLIYKFLFFVTIETYCLFKEPSFKTRLSKIEGDMSLYLTGCLLFILFTVYCYLLSSNILSRWHKILKQKQQPQRLICQTPCTDKNILLECRAFALVRKQFFKVNNLSNLF